VLAIAVDRGKLDSCESKPGDEGLLESRPSHTPGGLKRGNKPADGGAHRCCAEWIGFLFGLKSFCAGGRFREAVSA